VYDDRVVPFDVEDAYLQQRSIGSCSDQHRQVFIYGYLAHRRADGVQDVRVDNIVLPRRLTDSHIDNISCLDSRVNIQRDPQEAGLALSGGHICRGPFVPRNYATKPEDLTPTRRSLHSCSVHTAGTRRRAGRVSQVLGSALKPHAGAVVGARPGLQAHRRVRGALLGWAGPSSDWSAGLGQAAALIRSGLVQVTQANGDGVFAPAPRVAVRTLALAAERAFDVVDHRQIWLVVVDRPTEAPLVFVQVVDGVDKPAGPLQAIPSRELLQVVFAKHLDAEPPGLPHTGSHQANQVRTRREGATEIEFVLHSSASLASTSSPTWRELHGFRRFCHRR
jgi:hypothetical protein